MGEGRSPPAHPTLPSSRQCGVLRQLGWTGATQRVCWGSLGSPSPPHCLGPLPSPNLNPRCNPQATERCSQRLYVPELLESGCSPEPPLPLHTLPLQVEHPHPSGRGCTLQAPLHFPQCALHGEGGAGGQGRIAAGTPPAPPAPGRGPLLPSLRCMRTALLSVRGEKREGGRREGGDLPIWLYLLRCLSHAPGGRCGSPRPAERGRAAPRRGCPAQGRGGRPALGLSPSPATAPSALGLFFFFNYLI